MTEINSHPLLATDTVSVWDVLCSGTCKHKSAEECVRAGWGRIESEGFPKWSKRDSSLWPGGGRQGWRMERLFGFG